jgi:CheY-specific phosphatase CheX
VARPRQSRSDEAILMALACGANVENAAQSAGVSASTVKRRLLEPEFLQRLQAMRADMVQRATGMLTAAALESVKTLLTLQTDVTPPSVRLGAARAVLELGVRLRETAELHERIAAMETQMAELRGGNAS